MASMGEENSQILAVVLPTEPDKSKVVDRRPHQASLDQLPTVAPSWESVRLFTAARVAEDSVSDRKVCVSYLCVYFFVS